MGSLSDEIILGSTAAVSTAASLFINTPQEAKWADSGPTFLAGQGLSIPQWQEFTKVGALATLGEGLGYYTALTATNPERYGNRALGYASTLLMTHGTIDILKKLIARERPDKSEYVSFPSEHTSLAFASSLYLSLDLFHTFKKANPSLVYGLVALEMAGATLTGIGRVGANRHYFLDVAAGAVLGSGIAVLHYYGFVAEEQNANNSDLNWGVAGAVMGGVVGVGANIVINKVSPGPRKKLSFLPLQDISPLKDTALAGLTLSFRT